MRRGTVTVWIAVIAVWTGVALLAQAETPPQPDLGVRLTGSVVGGPLWAGDVLLETAVGSSDASVALWGGTQVSTALTWMAGGEGRIARDWLTLRLGGDAFGSEAGLTIHATAAPPGWLLYDGNPSFIGGLSASASVPLSGDLSRDSLDLSPYAAAVLPLGAAFTTTSARLDVKLDNPLRPQVPASRIVSRVDVGPVQMDSTVIFSGLFRTFTSLVLAIHAPEMGLTVSGTIVPTGSGLAYRIATSLSWGTSDLLPPREGDTGKICTGDVCF